VFGFLFKDKMYRAAVQYTYRVIVYLDISYPKAIPAHKKGIIVYRKAIPAHKKGIIVYRKAIPAHKKGIIVYRKAIPAHKKGIIVYRKAIPAHKKGIIVYRKAIPFGTKGLGGELYQKIASIRCSLLYLLRWCNYVTELKLSWPSSAWNAIQNK
jgi:hypothetical protein